MSLRVVCLLEEWTMNAFYRSVGPLRALASMGHEVREVRLEDRGSWDELLRWGDLLHIHRSCSTRTISLVRRAKELGLPVVWDDDDDLTKVPKGTPAYRDAGGINGQRRLNARARLFELVDLVTTPSPTLGRSYLQGGAHDVCVIENYVIDDFVLTGEPRDGTWIGWVANMEHRLDLSHIPVTAALQRLLDAHADVHVMTIGVRLPLSHPRYEHVPGMQPLDLLRQVSTWDVGIAPISTQVAINHSRSNVKLKEYAAVGVPWLASPIGPYVEMGEDEGGRLVPDDRWYEELDAMVSHPQERERLAEQATRWGEDQLLSRNVDLWEGEFEALIEESRGRLAG
jgi:glycosyltransferase involved in cell wall biosynthesis